MQVDAFRQNIGGDEDAVVVAGFSRVGIEVRDDFAT